MYRKLVLLPAALILFCRPAASAADRIPPLLRYRERQLAIQSSPPVTARYRVVVDARALLSRRFSLRLPGDKNVTAVQQRQPSQLAATKTVSARLKGIGSGAGAMSLSYRGRKGLFGVIELPGQNKSYVLRSDGRQQFLEVLNPGGYPVCATARQHEKLSLQPPLARGGVSDPVTARVMVVYTTAAKNAAGGASQMLAEINTAVTLANSAYSNSLIPHRISLIHSAELADNETGDIEQDLTNLTNVDGKWDQVHTWRQTYGADYVSLLIQTSSYCGMAWLTPSNASFLFSVVVRTCISNHSFVHELGHNTGAGHDVAAGGPGVYAYSSGWKFTGNNSVLYRTVMAYAPGTRINYFSNPGVVYQGQPTGVEGSANNAATLNILLPTAAAALNDVNTPAPTATPTATETPGVSPTSTPNPGNATPPPGSTPAPTATVTATPTPTSTPDDASVPPLITPQPTPTSGPVEYRVRLERLPGAPKLLVRVVSKDGYQRGAGLQVVILRKVFTRGAQYVPIVTRAANQFGELQYKMKRPAYYKARLASGAASKAVKFVR